CARVFLEWLNLDSW
nr:immunoglobulin heavy chain junction region [Macaca mulatta]